MHHLTQYLGKVNESKVWLRLPDYGPLSITNYNKYLEEEKPLFLHRWEQFKHTKEQDIKLEDKDFYLQHFEKTKFIGAGTFGQVYLVTNKKTGDIHAMKAVLKKIVVELAQVNNTKTEKLVLQCTNCPFMIHLDYFFKDNSYLYFIMPFIRGGELFHYLQLSGRLSEPTVMFYASQVIMALQYLHYFDFIYRDLKPENLLVDHTGYVKLTDFGFCKHLAKGRTYTICGTPDYLAPETIRSEGYGKAVDWWAVGVLLYELTVGFAPFKEKQDSQRYQRILTGNYRFPSFLSEELKDLIKNALQVDVTKRIGNMKNGVEDFKNHKWFKPLNWTSVVCRKAEPPFVPEVDDEDQTKHFKDHPYRSLEIANKLEYGKEFAGF